MGSVVVLSVSKSNIDLHYCPFLPPLISLPEPDDITLMYTTYRSFRIHYCLPWGCLLAVVYVGYRLLYLCSSKEHDRSLPALPALPAPPPPRRSFVATLRRILRNIPYSFMLHYTTIHYNTTVRSTGLPPRNPFRISQAKNSFALERAFIFFPSFPLTTPLPARYVGM